MLVQLKKHFYQSLILLAAVVFALSCQKDIKNTDTGGNNNIAPDLTTKVTSSVSGYVVNENNDAVLGATVHVGTASTTTDKYGYFSVRNVDVVKTAAVVTVTYPGYFNAVKTWGATANKAATFRIKLIPKTNVGTIDAAAGGNVTLSNGLVVALPANGVVIASNSAAYTGPVNVAAFWINPQANDLTEIMPGDLRGLDKDGLMKGLTTYGMAAVELTGASGQLLQIASGKKATLTMPLSSQLLANAPNSIPLWYFDEAAGLWKEDGTATKTGNAFVGDVSHFSYWNCDLPNATVPLTFNVVDINGNPVANVHVEIVPTTPNSWSHVGGLTDSTGYVSVFVTPNTSYQLSLYSNCVSWGGTPSYSQNFSVTDVAVNLGNIVVPAAITATLSGTVTDCSGNPVTNGFVYLLNGYYYIAIPIDNSGSYSYTSVICSGSITSTIVAEDINGGQESTPITYTIVPGNNSIGNIQACGTSNAEFITYSVDGGTDTTFTPIADSLNQGGNGTTTSFYISGSSNNPPPSQYSSIFFQVDNTGIAVGSVQNLLSIYCTAFGQVTIGSPIGINITEYGPVGGFIAGNFTGTVTDAGSVNHTITCSFRVRRGF